MCSGSIRMCALALVAMLGVSACNEDGGEAVSGGVAESVSPAATAVSAGGVLAATAGAGDVKLRVDVQAHMPSDFDDGIPDRSFGGTGFFDQDQGVAGINYKMSGVPNSAGYFGQVDSKMSVFYSGDGFTISFPEMAQALPGRLDWLSYDLAVTANPKAQELGIGQLREVGLSDPRLALALLGGTDSLQPGAPPSPTGSSAPPTGEAYAAAADVARAAGAATPDVRAALAELQALDVTTVQLALTLDEERRVETVGYSLSYPPKPGSDPVDMTVTFRFQKYGLEGGLHPPTGRSVSSFEEYLEI